MLNYNKQHLEIMAKNFFLKKIFPPDNTILPQYLHTKKERIKTVDNTNLGIV